jgi:hypothetical protein
VLQPTKIPEPLRLGIEAMGSLAATRGKERDARIADPTALCYAVAHGDVDTVETLLTMGADPNIATLFGLTPLHIVVRAYANRRSAYKCAERWSTITRLLLEAGADPIAKDFRGSIPAAWGEGLVPPPLRDLLIEFGTSGVWKEDDRLYHEDVLSQGPNTWRASLRDRVSTDTVSAAVKRAKAHEEADAARTSSGLAHHRLLGTQRRRRDKKPVSRRGQSTRGKKAPGAPTA